MIPAANRTICALGDAADPACWSGIPYHFWREAKRLGFAENAGRVDLAGFKWPRRWWNGVRKLRGRGTGGYQYSSRFLDAVETQLPAELMGGDIISFNQIFPRAETVRRAGGTISYYVDATLAALTSGRGLDIRLPADVLKSALKLERENYRLAERVVAMARWTAESLVEDCGVPREKVFTILPGANLDLPVGWTPKEKTGRPGIDRDLILGFVGKDWKRKGLPLLIEVRDLLALRGWKVKVRAAGEAPRELAKRTGVEFVGFIDKKSDAARFADFVASCDIGCLFSEREALGISTLEFLRVGVPVAGFAIEGPADTLPHDAGFRFSSLAKEDTIAEHFENFIRDGKYREELIAGARSRSQFVTWENCVREFKEICVMGYQSAPLQLYRF